MKDYISYNVEDFANDLSFIKWALNEEQNVFFDVFYEEHPYKREEMDEAVEIVKWLSISPSPLSDNEVYQLWDKIKSNAKPTNNNSRRLILTFIEFAAIFMLVFFVGRTYYLQNQNLLKEKELLSDNDSILSKKSNLILSDGQVIPINADTSKIRYNASGSTVKVDSQSIKNEIEDKNALNKLTIPYGKRSQITLSDGTKIWINSGTKLMYPSVFEGNKRIVYLTGEAYFKVARNEKKPFIVKTTDIDIEVLGTEFNVNAYSNNDRIETVVAEGKVAVRKKKISLLDRSTVLNKAQMASFRKKEESMKVEEVDPIYYTSWKDGYLILKNEKLEDIAKKLTQFYNINIEINDNLKSLEFSGKLDIREKLETELRIISTAHPISYTLKENKVIIGYDKPAE